MNADNITDEVDALKKWLDKMAKASSPEQRLEIYIEATGCLWRMNNELDELKDILKNRRER